MNAAPNSNGTRTITTDDDEEAKLLERQVARLVDNALERRDDPEAARLIQRAASSADQLGALIKHQLSPGGASLLHKACLAGCASTAQLLLDLGADIHAVNDEGLRPMHFWAMGRHNDEALLDLLISRGASVDGLGRAQRLTRPAEGSGRFAMAPLRLALEPAALALLARRADPRALDKNGESLEPYVFEAIRAQHGRAALAAIQADPDLGELIERWGPRILRMAAGRSEIRLAKIMIDHGVDPRGVDPVGAASALHLAACAWSADSESALGMILLLLDSGADMDALDSDGRTPEEAAAKHPRFGHARLFLSARRERLALESSGGAGPLPRRASPSL